MITTRQVSVDLAKEKLRLRGVTTKNIDASARVEPPKAKIKPRGVTTTTLADVEDIREKKRRDDIMAERKAEAVRIKDEKPEDVAETVVKIIEPRKKLIGEDDEKIVIPKRPKLIEPSRELMAELMKKPWNKMNAKERKEYQVEKAKKKKERSK